MHRTQVASGARPSPRSLLFAVGVALVLALPARADITIQEKPVSCASPMVMHGAGVRSTMTQEVRRISREEIRGDHVVQGPGRNPAPPSRSLMMC